MKSRARSATACAKTSSNLKLSRELATIRDDVDLEQGIDDLSPGRADVPRLRELYGRFELAYDAGPA